MHYFHEYAIGRTKPPIRRRTRGLRPTSFASGKYGRTRARMMIDAATRRERVMPRSKNAGWAAPLRPEIIGAPSLLLSYFDATISGQAGARQLFATESIFHFYIDNAFAKHCHLHARLLDGAKYISGTPHFSTEALARCHFLAPARLASRIGFPADIDGAPPDEHQPRHHQCRRQ